MKLPRLLTTLVVVLLVASIAASTVTSFAAQPKNTSNKEMNYVPDKILVRFIPSIAASAAVYKLASNAASASIGATVIQQYAIVPGLEVVMLPSGLSVTDAIAHYQKNGNVAYAEPDYIFSLDATATLPASPLKNDSGYTAAITPNIVSIALPNDPYYPDQWAFPDMNASGAWNKTTGSTSIIIADVDTGVDVTHPDLAANLLPEVNFVPNLTYDCMHGTHTAGIIGAVGNNGIGITGTNWRTTILPLEAGNESGLPNDAIISAWQYAASYGATIINNSFGSTYYSQAMRDTIDACPQCLFVCSAGNDGVDNGIYPHYPASFREPNIISVAAIDSDDILASFSDYGATSVHLGAPGVVILSTIWMNTTGTESLIKGYDFWDGTSMAAPYVTGVAGLIKTVNPSLNVAQVKNAILNNVDRDSYLSGKVITGGKLDAGKAVSSVKIKTAVSLSGVQIHVTSSSPPAKHSITYAIAGALTTTQPKPAGIANAKIILQWSKDDTNWSPASLTPAVTNATGAYAFKGSLNPGTYYFRTAYNGSSTYTASFSRVVKVSVSATGSSVVSHE